MNKKMLFISDLHLDEGHTQTTALFMNFLNQLDESVEALYILGDFFDVWVGDDGVSDFHQKIQRSLKKASEICPIYFMSGNRDFLIGKRFAQNTGCILLKDPTVVNLYGAPTLLTHGDSLCIQDVRHIRFRAFSQHPFIQFLFLKLPLTWRKKAAASLRRKSRQHLAIAPKYSWDIPEVEVCRVMTQLGVRQMIHGHTHSHLIYPVKLKDAGAGQRIGLGDWEDSGSIMVCRPKTDGKDNFLTENVLVHHLN